MTVQLVVQIFQAMACVAFLVLMAVQTEKAEQGGVMGIGGASGRSSGEIDMAVGPERILKPLTKWTAIGFLFLSVLSAIPAVNIVHVLIGLAIYVAAMTNGDRLWNAITGRNR